MAHLKVCKILSLNCTWSWIPSPSCWRGLRPSTSCRKAAMSGPCYKRNETTKTKLIASKITKGKGVDISRFINWLMLAQASVISWFIITEAKEMTSNIQCNFRTLNLGEVWLFCWSQVWLNWIQYFYCITTDFLLGWIQASQTGDQAVKWYFPIQSKLVFAAVSDSEH